MPPRAPRLKVIRRLGVQLPGLTRKSAERESRPAGAPHAGARRQRPRTRPSAYRTRLEEKQKVRFNYGVTERQMRRYVAQARALPGETGTNLLALLERRLDNVVFRLGLAPTVPAARQLVAHGHIVVNGRRLDRPSYLAEIGDRIALAESARRRPALAGAATAEPVLRVPGHISRDPSDPGAGVVVALPSRADVPFPVRESLIVEFYAR